MYDRKRDICGWLKEPEVNSDEPVYIFEDIVPYGTRITKRSLERMIARASPSRYPVPAKKEPQREGGLTPAEIEAKLYVNPERPPEGVDASWVLRTLHVMAKYKRLPIDPSDWFERDEVERWFKDFGPEDILSAFRSFIADKSKSNNGHPLQSFRTVICMICRPGVDSLESARYAAGKLCEAPSAGRKQVENDGVKTASITPHIEEERNMNNTSWDWDWDDMWADNANPTPVEPNAPTSSLSNEAVSNVPSGSGEVFGPLRGEDGWHPVYIHVPSPEWAAEVDEFFGVKGDAMQEEVTSSSRYFSAPPSPSELANLGSWDRAYEQALDAWEKEHPNLTRAETMRSFENDDQYLTRVSTIFQGA